MDKLLKLLSENSGFTTAEIAAMLGEPEDYIKAQIKEYENSGVIKGYQAVVNWDMVDDSYVEALIELQVTPKKEQALTKWQNSAWALKRLNLSILWQVHMTLLSL